MKLNYEDAFRAGQAHNLLVSHQIASEITYNLPSGDWKSGVWTVHRVDIPEQNAADAAKLLNQFGLLGTAAG